MDCILHYAGIKGPRDILKLGMRVLLAIALLFVQIQCIHACVSQVERPSCHQNHDRARAACSQFVLDSPSVELQPAPPAAVSLMPAEVEAITNDAPMSHDIPAAHWPPGGSSLSSTVLRI